MLYVSGELFTNSCEKSGTGHATKSLTMHNFAGLILPQQYLANGATQPTAIVALAHVVLQLYCIFEEV